jgi:ribosomal protein S1/tRNA A-37 threonylcarbamoyl transferase component Bud32
MVSYAESDSRGVIVNAEDGKEVYAVNEVFPVLRPGEPLLLYPSGRESRSTLDPRWYVPRPVPLRQLATQLGFKTAVRKLAFQALAADILAEPALAGPAGREATLDVARLDRLFAALTDPSAERPAGPTWQFWRRLGELVLADRAARIRAAFPPDFRDAKTTPLTAPQDLVALGVSLKVMLDASEEATAPAPGQSAPRPAETRAGSWGALSVLDAAQLSLLARSLLEEEHQLGYGLQLEEVRKSVRKARETQFLEKPRTVNQLCCQLAVKQNIMLALVRRLFPEPAASAPANSPSAVPSRPLPSPPPAAPEEFAARLAAADLDARLRIVTAADSIVPAPLSRLHADLGVGTEVMGRVAAELFPDRAEAWRQGEDAPLHADEVRWLAEVLRGAILRPADGGAWPGDLAARVLEVWREGYTFGDRVHAFTVSHADPDSPGVIHGTFDGVPAITRRDVLSPPMSHPLCPIISGVEIGLTIADPTSRPVVLASAYKDFALKAAPGGLPEVPRSFFPALRALARRSPTLPATVRYVDERKVSLSLYGVLVRVFAEHASWDRAATPNDLFRVGQQVEPSVFVDLERFQVDASLKPAASVWESVVARFPVGAVIPGAVCVARTNEGLLFDLPSTGLRLLGLAPYGELTDGNDPFEPPEDVRQPQRVVITGHDAERRRLRVALRPLHASPWDTLDWQPGRRLPVRARYRMAHSLFVGWAPGHLVRVADEEARRLRRPVAVARVEHIDRAARTLDMTVAPPPRLWTVTAVGADRVRLRADDGLELDADPAPFLAEAGPGTRLALALTDLRFEPDGPRVSCRPWTDADDVLDSLQLGATCEVTVLGEGPDGLHGSVSGLSVLLPADQVDTRRPASLAPYIGQTLPCSVIAINPVGSVVSVSHRATVKSRQEEQRQKVLAEAEPGQLRKGVVKSVVHYGAFVDLGGIDGLLHVNEVAWGRPGDPHEKFTPGQEIEAYVLSVDREKEKIALSLKYGTPNPWAAVAEKYPVGSRHTVEVLRVMPYGAFVRLENGVEGLVHKTEMSRSRNFKNPDDLVAAGDRVEVEVLGINADKQEISLGMKQTQRDPWGEAAEKYPPGTIVEGVVRNILKYGAFVEVEEGIDGLLHVNEISRVRQVTDPHEVLSKGERVRCVVLTVEPERRRLGLGMKQLEVDVWQGGVADRYHAGQLVTGTVAKLTNFGAFVELEPGLQGLIHSTELAEQKVKRPDELLQVGDVVRVKVLRVEPAERKIGLSLKQIEPDGSAAILAASPCVEAGSPNSATGKETDVVARSPDRAAPRDRRSPEAQGDLRSGPVARSGDRATTRRPAEVSGLWRYVDDATASAPEEDDFSGGDEEEEPPPVAPADAVGLDSDLEAWLCDAAPGGEELARSLESAGLAALASLVRVVGGSGRPDASWEGVPAWAGASAVAEARRVTRGWAEKDAPSVELLLRTWAGNPGEVLVSEALAAVLPARFVNKHGPALRAWLAAAWGSADFPPVGLGLLEAWAREQLGDVEGAYDIVNRLGWDQSDQSLVQERNRLIERFDEALQQQPLFFNRYERVADVLPRRGGFAWVIPVRERDSGRRLALKRLRPCKLPPEAMRMRRELFDTEELVLSRLSEAKVPNVVAYHGTPARGWVLLEWLTGTPLNHDQEFMAEGKWRDVRRALDLGLHVASTFDAAGRVINGFTHNDLWPPNVMIDRGEEGPSWVKLIDFGLAAGVELNSLSSVMDELAVDLRKPYRPPEVSARGARGPRGDMYSLGVILFELLTGWLPARPGALGEADRLRVERVGEYVADARVCRLLARLLTPAPEGRPASWAQVVAEFQQLLAV